MQYHKRAKGIKSFKSINIVTDYVYYVRCALYINAAPSGKIKNNILGVAQTHRDSPLLRAACGDGATTSHCEQYECQCGARVAALDVRPSGTCCAADGPITPHP